MKRLTLVALLGIVLLAGVPCAEVLAWGNNDQLDRMEEKIDKISGDTQNILDVLGVIAEGTLPAGATLMGYADKVGWNAWVVAAHTGLSVSQLDNLPAGTVLKHPTNRDDMETAIKKGRELRKAYYANRKPSLKVNRLEAESVHTKKIEAELITAKKIEADLILAKKIETDLLIAKQSNLCDEGVKGRRSGGSGGKGVRSGGHAGGTGGGGYAPRTSGCVGDDCPKTSSVGSAWTKIGEERLEEYRIIYGQDAGARDLVTVKYWAPGKEVQVGVCNWTGTKERLNGLLQKALVKARELTVSLNTGRCSYACAVENCYMSVIW